MATKTITFSASQSYGSYVQGKIELTSSSETSSNTSDVTAKIYVRKADHDSTLTIPTEGSWYYTLTVNGTKRSGSVHASVLESWVLLYSGTWNDIAHGSDGTKSISVSGSVSGPSETSYAGKTSSGSTTFTLDSIPRASTLTSAGNVTLGNACSVKWTPKAASFRYKLKFVLGSWSYTTGAIHPNTTSAYTYTGYTIPLDVASQIPSATTGTMTVYLYTYSDSAATTQVGSASSKTFTITVPNNSSTQPAVSMSLAPVHSLGSAFSGLYIQGKSKVKASLSAAGKYGASISAYSMKTGGTTYDSSDSYTSDYLGSYGSIAVTGYAKDSRGFTGSKASSITVIAYSKPKIQPISGESEVVAARCDSSGNLSDSGTYLKIKARRSYSAVKSGGVQKNFCQIRYRYKKEGAASYSAWTTILAGSTTSTDEVVTGALLGGALALDSSYLVQVGVLDDIGEFAETTITISTEKVYMDRNGELNSMGLGKYAEHENALDLGWDLYMNDNTITGLPAPVDPSDAVPRSFVDSTMATVSDSHFLISLARIGATVICVISPKSDTTLYEHSITLPDKYAPVYAQVYYPKYMGGSHNLSISAMPSSTNPRLYFGDAYGFTPNDAACTIFWCTDV